MAGTTSTTLLDIMSFTPGAPGQLVQNRFDSTLSGFAVTYLHQLGNL
jgi:hypothetical protein